MIAPPTIVPKRVLTGAALDHYGIALIRTGVRVVAVALVDTLELEMSAIRLGSDDLTPRGYYVLGGESVCAVERRLDHGNGQLPLYGEILRQRKGKGIGEDALP